jgi:hypothetical protein
MRVGKDDRMTELRIDGLGLRFDDSWLVTKWDDHQSENTICRPFCLRAGVSFERLESCVELALIPAKAIEIGLKARDLVGLDHLTEIYDGAPTPAGRLPVPGMGSR